MLKKLLIFLIPILLWSCCPFLHSDCYCTVEKDLEVRSIKEYPDIKYYVTLGEYEWNKDTVQELFYTTFRLYIDSVNIYNITEPFSVKAYISDDHKMVELDSSEIRISYTTIVGFGVFIKRKFYEPKLHLKIVIIKENHNEVIFEFDIEQESVKRRNSKRFNQFIQT